MHLCVGKFGVQDNRRNPERSFSRMMTNLCRTIERGQFSVSFRCFVTTYTDLMSLTAVVLLLCTSGVVLHSSLHCDNYPTSRLHTHHRSFLPRLKRTMRLTASFFLLLLLLCTEVDAVYYWYKGVRVYQKARGTELGSEEYTMVGSISVAGGMTRDLGCIQCSANGPCLSTGTYGASGTQSKWGGLSMSISIDAWEDDNGNRCEFKNGTFINDDDDRVRKTCTLDMQSYSANTEVTYRCDGGNAWLEVVFKWWPQSTDAPPTPPATPIPDTPAPTQCTTPDTAPLTCEATASHQCAWRVVQSGRLLAVGFSADGSRVATGSDDGVRVYDSTTGVQVAKLACADFASYDVTFSSDGARVAVGGAGGRVVVCDAVTGALEVTLMDMRAVGSVPVRRVRFTADARFLVVSGGGSDMRTRVFDVMSGSLEPEIVIHKHAREVAFSADGALLATSWGTEVDEVVTVWRVRNGAKVAELPSRFARVTALSFSASGDELLRGMDDGTVRVSKWGGGVVGDGAVTERLVLETQTKTVFDARHSPNGALLAAVGEGEVTVWRAAGGVAHQLYGHTRAGLPRLAFSPDSTRLATASHDGTLLLWDLL